MGKDDHMPRQLPLFGEDPGAGTEAAKPESAPADAAPGGPGGPPQPAPVARELAGLAKHLPKGLHLGTSSWAFPGWIGLVYAGRHDKQELARRGLPAYARHPLLWTVGLDRTFYRPESVSGLRELARDLPAGFRVLSKAPASLTQPALPPNRNPAGAGPARWEDNPGFLDPDFARREVVEPLIEGLGAHAGPLVFQFSPLPRFRLRDPAALLERLHRFLRSLPEGPIYAVEVRNPELLREDYAQALTDTGAVHAVNVHPTMPTPREQAERLGEGPFRAGLVLRWMLGHDQEYEEAKSRYAPFDRIIDADPDSRRQIAALALETAASGKAAFVVINNKAEGSAPLSALHLAQAIRAKLEPGARH